MGPPARICFWNNGTTLPELPSTLPKRTIEKRVTCCVSDRACRISSASRLEVPMILVGRTALSVEISTKSCTPHSTAAVDRVRVPNALVRMPSAGLCSTMGTCLYAAA